MSGQPFRARFGFDALGQKGVNFTDGTLDTDLATYGQLRKHADIRVVADMAALPRSTDPDKTKRPEAGHSYLVLRDDKGRPLNRLLTWNPAGDVTGGVLEVHVTEPPADAAIIAGQAGNSDGGLPFTAGGGTAAVLDLMANADGSITGTVTSPGSGYRIGDSATFAAGSLAWGAAMTGDTVVTVSKINAATPLGGWVGVGVVDWVRAARTDPSITQGVQDGDLQLLTERDHELIQTWQNGAWQTIYSTELVDARIAALSLFEGTVKQVGGTAVPGAIEIDALPDITDTTPATVSSNLADVSHYWTWTGTAGYVVQAGDGNGVGRDLAGAVMQVGDWIQLANRGGDGSGAPPNGGPPDFHWVHIGGDLLAKSRGDVLYGLQNFVAGNYETGSMVNSGGAIWRATQGVVPTDPIPGATGAPWAKVPLDIQAAGDFRLLPDPNGTGTLPLADGDSLVWNQDHFEPGSAAQSSVSFYVNAAATGFQTGTSLAIFTTGYDYWTEPRSANYIVQVSDATGDPINEQAHYVFVVTLCMNDSHPVRINLLNSSVGSPIRASRFVFTWTLNMSRDTGCYITPASDGSLNGSKWRVTVTGHSDLIAKLQPGDGAVIPTETVHREEHRSFPAGLNYPDSAMRRRIHKSDSTPKEYASSDDLWVKTNESNRLYMNFGDFENPNWLPIGGGGGAGGGATLLSGLADARIVTPADGELLQYNGTNNRWENTPPDFYTKAQVYTKAETDAKSLKYLSISKADYTALGTKDPTVLYLVHS